jgi:hypothetical protein
VHARVAEKRPSAGGVCSPSAPCARKFITRRGSRHYILANKQINSAARASFGLRCLRAGGAGCGGGGLLALFIHTRVWSDHHPHHLPSTLAALIWARSVIGFAHLSNNLVEMKFAPSPRTHSQLIRTALAKHSTARYTAISQLLVQINSNTTLCTFSTLFIQKAMAGNIE